MPRETCAELSRLPKLTKSLKSINFRSTTPGSVSHIVYSNRPPPPHTVLDPTHPALAYNGAEWNRAFRWWQFTGFTIRAFPKGLLKPPESPHPDPPFAVNEGPTKGHSLNMSLLDVAPKSVGGRVVRQEILRKIKTAISLIVVRGADAVKGKNGRDQLIFTEMDIENEEDAEDRTAVGGGAVVRAETLAEAGSVARALMAENDTKHGRDPQWILHDWTYLIRPQLEAYGMSYVTLIPYLRNALQRILAVGLRLEEDWVRAKARTVRTKGAAPVNAVLVPVKQTPIFTPEDREAAAHLLARLRQVEDTPAPSPSAAHSLSSATVSSRANAPEAADKDADSNPRTPLADLISRHSRGALTGSVVGGKIRPVYISPKRRPPSNKRAP
ncbi:hypothetical protein FKP32DRAFT_1599212 [Trametes sanguinea]|nr:hypothetical protein FKP32DRAFT_1599212 [Trametes sanguinea]